jgi:predicted GIY-YIG superfamily endonuclease
MNRGPNKHRFPSGWHCYLLLCSDGSYYCGITADLSKRIKSHASGRGSSYTKGAKALALVWHESHKDRHGAAARERQIKSWRHEKKHRAEEGPAFEGLGTRLWVSLD